MPLGPEHAIFRGLRQPGSEPELTRTLARIFEADSNFAAAFVREVLEASKRATDPRWNSLPQEFLCRSEVAVPGGRVDLQFSDPASGWRVLVELKIAAGYGFEQIERYLAGLDPADERHVLVSITRDRPTYGDPPINGNPNWAGSVAWASIFDRLRSLRPRNTTLCKQWPLFLDVLEYEGSMGVVRIDPELLMTWARAAPARHHAVALAESLRNPLLEALRDVLQLARPERPRWELASASDAIPDGRRPQIDLEYTVPAGGDVSVVSQLWAWEDFRFAVSVKYPANDRTSKARAAIAYLARVDFGNWKNLWLWRSMPLHEELLKSDGLVETLLEWAREGFAHIVESGILELPPDSEVQSLTHDLTL